MNTYVAPLSCGQVDTRKSIRPSLRNYQRLGIFVRQTHYENHLVRVNVDGKNAIMLNSDTVAYKRDLLSIRDRQVCLSQSPSKRILNLFYGFDFSFKYPSMFATGEAPQPDDVRCHHHWNLAQPAFRVMPYKHYTAGYFILSGVSLGTLPLFLHLGFDLDFAPVCLITSSRPDASLPVNLEELDATIAQPSVNLVPLSWLLTEIAEGETQQNVLAFRGHPNKSAQVHCRSLLLKISFEIASSPGTLQLNGWRLLFEKMSEVDKLAQGTTRLVVPVEEITITQSVPVITGALKAL